MKTAIRWALRLGIAMLALILAGFLSLDTVARKYVEHELRRATGLETRIGAVRVGLLTPELTVKNLVMYNRAEFGGAPFIDLPELHVEYDRKALRAGKLHCHLVELNLARLNIVEDKQGRRNFEMLQKSVAASNLPEVPNGQPQRTTSGIQFTGIDTLNLTLGKATYVRMAQPDKLQELDMNVDHQIFNNIKTEQDLGSMVVVALLRSGANLMQGGGGQTWLQLLTQRKR